MLTQEADDPLAVGEAQLSFYNQLENKRIISLDLRCVGEQKTKTFQLPSYEGSTSTSTSAVRRKPTRTTKHDGELGCVDSLDIPSSSPHKQTHQLVSPNLPFLFHLFRRPIV